MIVFSLFTVLVVLGTCGTGRGGGGEGVGAGAAGAGCCAVAAVSGAARGSPGAAGVR